MYPILFSIAGFHLSSFSIFLILAWCVFSFVFWKSLREEGTSEERIFDLTFYGSLAAFVASRVGFVLTHWDLFTGVMLKVIALWVAPGLSLVAAVTAGLAAMIVLARRAKVRVGLVLDAVGLALPGALVVGAVGSLLDGTVVGRATSLPWAIRYVGHSQSRHPYQVYEIIALALILAAIGWMTDRARTKKWALGSVGVGFFLLWTTVSFGLEFVRDSRIYWHSLSANQWAALVLFSVAVAAWYMYTGGKFMVRGVAGNIRAIKGTSVS